MWHEDIYNHLKSNPIEKVGTNIFIYEIPIDSPSPSVMVLPEASGVKIDKEIGDFFKASFQVVVRDINQESAYLVADDIRRALTIPNKIKMEVATYKVILPLHLPIVYPRMDSDHYEASVNFDTYFTMN